MTLKEKIRNSNDEELADFLTKYRLFCIKSMNKILNIQTRQYDTNDFLIANESSLKFLNMDWNEFNKKL